MDTISLKDRKLEIRNLFFSEGTYQLEIWDSLEKVVLWPFLQIDDHAKILDCFCTCSEAEKKGSCLHVQAVLNYLCRPKPLHIRFRNSLWNQICQIAARRHGFQSKGLQKKSDGVYEAFSVTGKVLLSISAKKPAIKAKLEEIILHEAEETEETSLKFSKISAEELLLWKQGRPSRRLQYELSFWSDLAKWWMLLQEEGQKYEIKFIDGKEDIPKGIEILFSDLHIRFYVAEVNWNQIIPALSTVKSPLKVFEIPGKSVENISYDATKKMFLLNYGKTIEEEKNTHQKEGYPIGDWIYVPAVGFYPAQKDPIFEDDKITQDKIPYFLKRYSNVLQTYLSNTKIYDTVVPPYYHLEFIPDKGLEIAAYVFEKGDLQKSTSAFFPPWVYLEKKGFYLLDELHFDQPYFIVPLYEVADFVEKHRFWLHQFDGFQIQVSSVESKVSYHVSDKGLYFDAVLSGVEEAGEIFDLGRFLYVKGRGFYTKSTSRTDPIRPGVFVPSMEVSRFIRENHDELSSIPGFFDIECPLEKVGLKIEINAQDNILVTPEYSYKTAGVMVFGDYTYTPGKGFSEIPPHLRIPDMYREQTVITPDYEPYFLGYELQMLEPFILKIDPRLQKPREILLEAKRVKRLDRGRWSLELEYTTEIGSVSAFDVYKGVMENKNYLFSSAGLIYLKLPRFQWLKNTAKKKFSSLGKQLRLSTLEWLKLEAFDTMHFENNIQDVEKYLSFYTPPLPALNLQTKLRPYQESGLNWLWFLYSNGLSGFLCDEMGLGKTHQTMSLLAAIKASKETINVLVICPTSVMYHWQKLLERFLPDLKVILFHGAQRVEPSNYDVLLTSYGIVRSEKDFFQKQRFDLMVFDEIQAAKNVKSQIHKVLKKIPADMRIGLTGTPIENTLLELKALFDLVLPGYMPSDNGFREMFLNPIEKFNDAQSKQLLGRIIKPFILRRKKSEVLLELPEKTEEIAYCELSKEQAELYQKTFALSQRTLIDQLQDTSTPIPYVHIFALLTSLKRICDHPCLIHKNIHDFQKHPSGKWDLFVELLAEARESKQKVVVFSQYLDMLDIIELYLQQNQIGFAKIRGSTRDRMEQVERFRIDPQCEVFVASLQAAGVGIDLVSASVVIHYDRWWNPAKENQATDRVHRIGQDRGVQVFKMVTKGTIEESIHQMIEKKMGLFESVVGFDDHQQVKHFQRDELLQILQMTSMQ